MQRKVMTIGVVACVLALMFGGLSLAQQQGQRQRGQGGDQGGRQFDPGQRGQFDPAQMRQRMTERMKEQLGVNDAEWKVFEPRLTRVMELSRQGAGGGPGGMMGMMFGRGQRGGPGGDQGGPGGDRRGPQGTQTGLQKAMTQLQTTLENQSASPEEIKKQLTTVRQERVRAQQELAVARSELQKICTPRQEAQLVVMGMLE
jgi:hypothetical protein